MEDLICSFFGHREIDITKELQNSLISTVMQLIEKGFNNFYFGGFGEFDNLCYAIVTNLQQQYPNIKRTFCYVDKRWQGEPKRPSWLTKNNYEEIIYLQPSFDYWYQQIYYRNCAMIDNSQYVVFYVENSENSGAYKAMQYAIKTKKQLLNLANI